MLPNPPVWLVLVAFVCALGPLVFFHELGHYLVARLFGIPADTFSIGFGHELVGWTDRQGTRWKIAWLPLGGYVRFVGDMSPASNPAELESVPEHLRDRIFQTRPVWQRFLVVLAGPATNFLLAIIIIAGFIGTYGASSTPNVVIGTLPHSAAQTAGLRRGDRIVAIAGRRTEGFEEIAQLASMYPDQTIRIGVQRGSSTFDVDVHIGAQIVKDRFGQKYRIGLLGIPVPKAQFTRVPMGEVIPTAIERTAFLTRSMAAGLWQIVAGQRSIRDIGGPVKIAQFAGQQAQLGLEDFIGLVALLSINLGFINLLPVPMLDGGHLFFYAIEGVRRRPVSAEALDWAFRGGFAVILALLVFVTINDLSSLGLWERLQRLIG
jgi:regulator of sigma E protease